jgi:diguanylate cyclase (GGDEF)-like protein
MMLDVDHFKKFNDTYGHQAGDEVLQFVAKTMKECVRGVDIVARLGGEEFAILCPEQSEEEAFIPAERIREKLQDTKLRLLTGTEVNVTMSIGISQFPRDSPDRDGLLDAADQALYHSKHTGRNRVSYYHQVEPEEIEAKAKDKARKEAEASAGATPSPPASELPPSGD